MCIRITMEKINPTKSVRRAGANVTYQRNLQRLTLSPPAKLGVPLGQGPIPFSRLGAVLNSGFLPPADMLQSVSPKRDKPSFKKDTSVQPQATHTDVTAQKKMRKVVITYAAKPAPPPPAPIVTVPAAKPNLATEHMETRLAGHRQHVVKGRTRDAYCNNIIDKADIEKPVLHTEELIYDVKLLKPSFKAIVRTGVARLLRAHGREAIAVEAELLGHLQLEAMFQKRSAKLLLLLKTKAIQWLKNFSKIILKTTEIVALVGRTVAAAMCVHEVEEEARQLLGDQAETLNRAKHTDFLHGKCKSGLFQSRLAGDD
ncbi:hypothetical protein 1 [Sanxia tombus-like virus 5]|uniref:hypothetical protein 1 n=1 Tax=Sanxia tombus-like virus 5 TaxID=1923389 RepID=UPI00090A6356|nr:hypothetical protein 1 [Sanxia tombus-like virus 5]APG76412.1 hypothetical protein 1 [Sanxia tombus-like virus 5]